MIANPETQVGGPEANMQQLLLVNAVSDLAYRIPPEQWRPIHEDSVRISVRHPYFTVGREGSFLNSPGSMEPTDLFIPLYGERLVATGGRLHLETAGYHAVEKIGTWLRDEILVNEGGRVGRLTLIPDDMKVESGWYVGGDHTGHPSWLRKWLTAIHGGTWPIMNRKIPDINNIGEFTDDPYTHDFSEVQLGNLELGPREIQTEYTRVAWHELIARISSLRTGRPVEGLLLPGESTLENDPLAYFRDSKANPRIFHNGIAELENTTNSYAYMKLLANLAVLDLGERLQLFQEAKTFMGLDGQNLNSAILRYTRDLYGEDPESSRRARLIASVSGWLDDQASVMVSVANFNCRAERGRNLTGDEQAEKVEAHFNGILRVAGKLRGDFAPAA